MNEFAPDRINEEPPFDLKTILRGTEFSGENYVDFQSWTDNPAQVLKDLADAGKEYGKGETGKQYAAMKLLTMIADYKEKLSPVDAGLLDLQVIQLLDIVYPEIVTNNYPHLDYWKQRIDFFRTKLEPVFQQNVEIGRKNVEIRNIENQLNSLQVQYREKQLEYFKYDLSFFTKKSNVTKFLNKTLPEVYSHEIDPEHPDTYFGYYDRSAEEGDMMYSYVSPSEEKNQYSGHHVKEENGGEKYTHIQPIILQGKKYYFPFDGYTTGTIDEGIEALKRHRVTINNDYSKMHFEMHEQFLKCTIQLKKLGIKNMKISYSDDIDQILAKELNTRVISFISLQIAEGDISVDFDIGLVKIDPLDFKPYPSFRYTPSVTNTANTVTTPEVTIVPPTSISENTTPIDNKTPIEILTERVGTTTIHFSTADYSSLFTKDSAEKAQVDAYIAQVKELLQQKPGAIKSMQLTGHVAWFHNTPPIDDEAMQASLQRAEAVKQYIQAQLPDITITTLGKGAEEALAAQAQGQDSKDDKFKRVDIKVDFNQ